MSEQTYQQIAQSVIDQVYLDIKKTGKIPETFMVRPEEFSALLRSHVLQVIPKTDGDDQYILEHGTRITLAKKPECEDTNITFNIRGAEMSAKELVASIEDIFGSGVSKYFAELLKSENDAIDTKSLCDYLSCNTLLTSSRCKDVADIVEEWLEVNGLVVHDLKPEPFTITKEQYDKDIAQAKKDAKSEIIDNMRKEQLFGILNSAAVNSSTLKRTVFCSSYIISGEFHLDFLFDEIKKLIKS